MLLLPLPTPLLTPQDLSGPSSSDLGTHELQWGRVVGDELPLMHFLAPYFLHASLTLLQNPKPMD